uniref:Uncharacterized protein n=1 Tax=Meloidogyne enterolobii TaxID=390850 RepID=A0A6V7VCU5_MELEN|nr:unnamed protein product [Meloidogyne enterolobii]
MSETNKGLLINRKDCYHYRDLYFDCLEKNNEDKNRCHREFEKFSDVCQSTWVSHFIRKRGVEKYKKTVEPKQDGKSDINANNQTDAIQVPSPTTTPKTPQKLNFEKIKNDKINQHFIRLLEELFSNNLPLEALNYCYSIFSTNFVINSRTLILAAKIVAMCHTTKTTISSIDSNKLNLISNKIQKELPNCENSIKLTIQLLLDASKGDWSKINILEQIPDKAECFAILASILIERREFDILSSLCSIIQPKQKFYQHPILWNPFLNFLEEFNNTKQCKELLELFMDQIVSIGKTITSEEFKCIQAALSYYKDWKVEEAIISKETLECSICKEKLPEQKPLDNEQFLKLRDAFREHLQDGLSNRISGENTANQRFYKTLDNLIIQTKSLKNSKPLIVDGLNLARGVYRRERFPYFNKIIVEMIEKKFFPILIISKTPFTYFYQNKLQKLPNVKLFEIEKEFKSKSEINIKYSTQDDLFAINSALYLGPNTHLLSNDNFVDHIGSRHFLPEIAPLFKIWRETRCISFIPDGTDEEKFFKLPNPFYAQIQGDALRGYHIFVKDKTDDIFNHVRDELVYCVRTK